METFQGHFICLIILRVTLEVFYKMTMILEQFPGTWRSPIARFMESLD